MFDLRDVQRFRKDIGSLIVRFDVFDIDIITKIGMCLYGCKMQYMDCNLNAVIHCQVPLCNTRITLYDIAGLVCELYHGAFAACAKHSAASLS